MSHSLRSVVLSLLAVAVLAGPAVAGPVNEFNRPDFEAAQQAGQRVMVLVTSKWSGFGERQRYMESRLSRDFLYPDVVFFRVDFQRMQDAMRELRVTQEGTVVVFRGTEERARTTGDFTEAELRHMLDVAR